MKNNRVRVGLGLLLCTTVVGILVKIPNLPFIGGDSEGWLGYWGSIVGIGGAYLVLRVQLSNDNKKHKAETVDNTFFNLLNLHNEILENKRESIENLYKSISIESEQVYYDNLKLRARNYIKSKNGEFNKSVKNLPDTYKIPKYEENGYLENPVDFSNLMLGSNEVLEEKILEYLITDKLDIFRNDLEELLTDNLLFYSLEESDDRYSEILSKLDFNEAEIVLIKNNKENYIKGMHGHSIFSAEKLDMSSNSSNEFIAGYIRLYNMAVQYAEYSFYDNLKESLQEIIIAIFRRQDIEEIAIYDIYINRSVEKAYKKNLAEIGYYFRLFYRIIKYINESKEKGYIDEDQRSNYIGLLRAVLDEKTLAIIYYNATYLEKGNNMKEQLGETYFFGKEKDFDDNNKTHSLFTEGTLFFEQDFENLKELTKAFVNK